MTPLIAMLTIDPMFPVAIEITPIAILMIDNPTLMVHAHFLALNSPYATTKDMMPMIVNMIPTANKATPMNSDGIELGICD